MSDKKANDKAQDVIPAEMEQPTVVDVAVAKLLSGASDPKTIEAWKELLNAHYNRPRHNPMADILQNKEAMEDIKSLLTPAMDKMAKNAMYHRIFLGACFFFLITAVVLLSYFDKLDPSAGVILGALAGYLFGKDD
jgi:hypothetical protein